MRDKYGVEQDPPKPTCDKVGWHTGCLCVPEDKRMHSAYHITKRSYALRSKPSSGRDAIEGLDT